MNRKLVLTFLRRYGIRLLVLGIVLFLLLRKDLSFQIRLKSPVRQELPAENPKDPDELERAVSEPLSQLEKPEANRQKFQMPGAWPSDSRPKRRDLPKRDGLPESEFNAFLNRFGKVARLEEEKFGIPSEIILAHSLLLSRAGKAVMSKEGNNFFGLPCTNDWKGSDGDYDGICLRHYPNAWTSFRDFSYYLSTGDRSGLMHLDPKDTRSWAKALKQEGFEHIPDYTDRILSLTMEIHSIVKP